MFRIGKIEMKYSVFAYSKKGCRTAARIIELLKDEEVLAWCPARLLEEKNEEELQSGQAEASEQNEKELRTGRTEASESKIHPGDVFQPIPKLFRPFYGERFADSDAMIFVGACGIAVREIAPFVKSKKTDPAVLCVDDRAQYVIPVLSGHIGGANELAAGLAKELGALAVITTATDINNKFSVDAWAARNGLVIDNMKAAKDVSAIILDQDIPLYCELPVSGVYPKGTYPWRPAKISDAAPEENGNCPAGFAPRLGIYISWKKGNPFAETLRLIPKVLTIGIGCRKGIKKEAVQRAVEEVLAESHIDIRAVREAASIDIKSEEQGLLDYCEERGWPIRFYPADELQAVKGEFSPSAFVQSVTGVDNVCERAAMTESDELLVRKTALDGVTVAVGLHRQTVSFSG